MILPIGGLPGKQLHVGSQHGVEESVRADEPDPHDGRWRHVGVAELLQFGDETGERGSDVGRASRVDDAAAGLHQLGGQVGGLVVAGVGQDHLLGKGVIGGKNPTQLFQQHLPGARVLAGIGGIVSLNTVLVQPANVTFNIRDRKNYARTHLPCHIPFLIRQTLPSHVVIIIIIYMFTRFLKSSEKF